MITPNIKHKTNYEDFKTITGNRNLNEKKVKQLQADIENGINLLPYCPIIVYDNGGFLHIIDGQHRFEAAKRSKQAVYYVVAEQMDLRDIAKLNSRSSNWKNADYLNCYINLGVNDYIILKDFMEDHNVGYNIAYGLLMKYTAVASGNDEKAGDAFREGTFVVNHFKQANDLMKIVNDIYLEEHRKNKFLVEATKKLVEEGKCDFKRLKSKITSNPEMITSKSNMRDYMYDIERIYNMSARERTTLFS